ncbi:hypothetical protein BG015_001844 [Linnemannia schmuckeri]|uniref:rhizopuspepsin n=1 Tax=Linnemannia schmuckeri TaxID=64567 RepID=A0A9P5RPR3_9FUNG|nr:hypothetical protein BG015_001844 [Linnemannia schmuckeri]
MKIFALVSLAGAALTVVNALPIVVNNRTAFVVPLTRNPHFKPDAQAQIAKLNRRYPGLNVLAASAGRIPLINVHPDLEYFGPVSVGTPAQSFKLNFDTGSADIWFPSSTCTAAACRKHTRFNAAQSSTYQKDGRQWSISYGDGSTASGFLGSDMIDVGGIQVRQTIGLATAESAQFGSSPDDGLFGLGFSTIESVKGVKTFLDNVIAADLLAQPVVSVFLPSERLFNGKGGEYLFGGIDSSKFTGSLIYVPVIRKAYWQVAIKDTLYNGQSLGQGGEGIIDTGTTLVIVDEAAAQAIHEGIDGALHDPEVGWLVPCSVRSDSANRVSFSMGGGAFHVPLADLAYQEVGSGYCYSGIQGGKYGLWILGDVFIKNNYCVFSQTTSPSIGIAPLAVN